MIDPQRAQWTLWDAALVVVMLAGLIYISRLPFQPPPPVGVEAPDTAFSADRALEHLRVIARGPHLPGSPEHARVREYLLDEFRSLGLEVEIQATTTVRSGGAGTRAVAVWNVVGRIPGTDPSGAVLLMAHYDPVPHSSGASDAGTGVAAIMEAVRALRSGPPLANDIIILISDGEELGLMGARAFVDRHRWFPEVSVVLNFEMRGNSGASWMFESGPDNGWIVREWARADPARVANSMSLDVYRAMPNDTDFSPFRDAGVQGLNFAAIGGGNVYHLSMDDLDHNSLSTLQHQGIQALAMARHLGNTDLGATIAPDVAFVRVALFGLIVHPPAWNWLGVLLAAGLAVATLVVGRRRERIRVKGVLAGLALAVASLLLAGLFGWLVFNGAQFVHPEYGRLVGSSFHREGWYLLAVMMLSLTLLLRIVGFGRRWFTLSELAWGGALIPLVLAALACWAAPMAALNLVWPVLFGELALLWFVLRLEEPPAAAKTRARCLLALALFLIPVLFILVPMTEILWVAMNISFAPVLAGLATLTFILLLPILAPLQSPNRWWAPTIGEALVVLFFGMGLSGGEPGPENPTPTALFYVMDRDQGSAWWATSDRSQETWLQAGVPAMELRQGDETFFPTGYFTASTSPVDVAAPEISVLADSVLGDRRILRLAISSGIGAELLNLRPVEGEEVALLWVNDWALNWEGGLPASRRAQAGSGTPWPLTHWGNPGGPVEVEVSVPLATQSVEFLLKETTYRPQELLGFEAFQRPPHLIPAARARTDLAMVGSTIQILLGSSAEEGSQGTGGEI